VIVNRAVEAARSLSLAARLLARRARAAGPRPPVVVVLPGLASRLVDERGRTVWGGVAQALRGPARLASASVSSVAPLEGFPIVPGLYAYDVMGGLFRFLERVGGYRRGEDLVPFSHDWRLGVRHGAEALAGLVARVRGASDEPVDLVALSSGGAIARAYLATAEPGAVRRVVHVGAPQRGNFSALTGLVDGIQLAPRAGVIPADVLQQVPGIYDFLPHPDDPLFVDESGAVLPLDLYDAAVWRELGLPGAHRAGLADRLREARALHLALDAAPVHRDVFAIAARHLRTGARVLVAGGRAAMPNCCAPASDPVQRLLHEPGDGAVPERSLAAVPGLPPERIWWLRPAVHWHIVRSPEAHALVLEGLIAPARAEPAALVRLSHRPPSRTTVAPFM
jgi:hypothetical protein